MRKRIIHLLTTMMVLLSVILPYQSVSAASSKQDLKQLDEELKNVKKVKPFNEFPKVKINEWN